LNENSDNKNTNAEPVITDNSVNLQKPALDKKTIIIVAICLVIGVLLGGGITWFGMSSSDDTDIETTSDVDDEEDEGGEDGDLNPTTSPDVAVDDTKSTTKPNAPADETKPNTDNPSAEPIGETKEFYAEIFSAYAGGGITTLKGEMPGEASLEKIWTDDEKKFEIVNNNFELSVSEGYEGDIWSYEEYVDIENTNIGNIMRVVLEGGGVGLYTYVNKDDAFQTSGQCAYIDSYVDAPCGNTSLNLEYVLLEIECNPIIDVGVNQCDDVIRSLSIVMDE